MMSRTLPVDDADADESYSIRLCWGSGAGGSSYSSDLSHHPEIRMLHSGFMLFVPGPRDCVKREA